MDTSIKLSFILMLLIPLGMTFSSKTFAGCLFGVYAGFLYVKGPSTYKFGYTLLILAVIETITYGSWDVYHDIDNYYGYTVPVMKNVLRIGLSILGSCIFFTDFTVDDRKKFMGHVYKKLGGLKQH